MTELCQCDGLIGVASEKHLPTRLARTTTMTMCPPICSAPREALVEAERSFLVNTLSLLKEVCPTMGERELLADAIKQLDELFLLVIVGEFNAGKSSVRTNTLHPIPILWHAP